jgi:PadR family transcriptional regulator PadR
VATTAEGIATGIRKGVLEFCVLALLEERERYGLELATELIDRELIASEGSLYPLLARMRDNDLVTTRSQPAGSGRPRRYYALTRAGREQLAAFADVWKRLGPQVDALVEGTS